MKVAGDDLCQQGLPKKAGETHQYPMSMSPLSALKHLKRSKVVNTIHFLYLAVLRNEKKHYERHM